MVCLHFNRTMRRVMILATDDSETEPESDAESQVVSKAQQRLPPDTSKHPESDSETETEDETETDNSVKRNPVL